MNTTKERGILLELAVKLYFKDYYSPKVWLWKEFARERGFPEQDIDVDLVVELEDKLYAVQEAVPKIPHQDVPPAPKGTNLLFTLSHTPGGNDFDNNKLNFAKPEEQVSSFIRWRDVLGHSTMKTTMEIYAQAQREKLIEVLLDF